MVIGVHNISSFLLKVMYMSGSYHSIYNPLYNMVMLNT